MEQTTVTPNFANVLGKRFHERYAATFDGINSKLTKAYSQDDYFDVPVSTLILPTGGGFTEYTDSDAFALAPPAVMGTSMVKHKAIKYILRVAVPWAEVEATHNDPKYFEKYFDKLVQEVYSATVARYGEPGTKVEFGNTYIDYVQPSGQVFLDNGAGDSLELRFVGNFAGEKK